MKKERSSRSVIKPSRRLRMYGFSVVLLGCLFFAARGYYDQTLAVLSRDFKPVYGGARCLIDGCDPYDSVQIESAFLRHGGDRSDPMPFRPFYAGYPPSALFLLVPLALLPFGLAHVIWLGLSIFLFCAAALCIADLCVGSSAFFVHCVLAVFVAQSTVLVMLGQPAMMSISLVVLAVWCFLKQRFGALGVIAFAVSLTLKPQEGALVWLFFLVASRRSGAPVFGTSETPSEPALKFRRRALQTLVVTLILMTPGILLAFHNPASANWPSELRTNLAGIAAHGNLCDPGPTNSGVSDIAGLQTIFSLISDTPRFYNAASFAVFVPLFLGWLYLVMRPVRDPERHLFRGAESTATAARDLLAIATAAALSFLAIYHREYDTKLLLLMFPAVAFLGSTNKFRGKAALALSVLATVTLSQQFLRLGSRLDHRIVNMPAIVRLGLDRPLPLTLSLLSCFFLYCMFRLSFEEREA